MLKHCLLAFLFVGTATAQAADMASPDEADTVEPTGIGLGLSTITEERLQAHLAFLGDDAPPTWNEGDSFGDRFQRDGESADAAGN